MKEEVAAARSGRTVSRLVVVFLRCELTNRTRLVASPQGGHVVLRGRMPLVQQVPI